MSGAPCKNPDCEYTANGDPEVSVEFCCEKCEGRFNGEEWAMSGKKKHTAYCTSKVDDGSWGGGGGSGCGGGCCGGGWGSSYGPAASWGGGGGWGGGQKCANPECEYMKNSDPSVSRQYCCEKCEGRHKGEDWAEGGKNHYKSCERNEGGGGGGGGPYGGSPWDKGSGKGGMLQMLMGMMSGKGKGKGDAWGGDDWGSKGGWGSKGDDWGSKGGWGSKGDDWGSKGDKGWGKKGKGGGKGSKGSSGPSLRDHDADKKVWVGGLPDDCDEEMLKAHFESAGTVVFAAMMKGKGTGGVAYESPEEATNVSKRRRTGKYRPLRAQQRGTGAVVFESPEEATNAMILNGSELGGSEIQVDVWTSA